MSSRIRSASSRVFLIQRIWDCTVSSLWVRRMSRFARITVMGVFSSWEASATKRFCWSQAFSTGLRAHRASQKLRRKKRANAARRTPARESRKERKAALKPEISPNITQRVPSSVVWTAYRIS